MSLHVCCLSLDSCEGFQRVNSFTVSVGGFPEFTRPAVTWKCPAYWVVNKRLLEKRIMPRRPQQLSVFYVAESDGLCFHLSQASPSQDLCEEHKWKESRLRMNERRWCPDVHSQSVSTVFFFFFNSGTIYSIWLAS